MSIRSLVQKAQDDIGRMMDGSHHRTSSISTGGTDFHVRRILEVGRTTGSILGSDNPIAMMAGAGRWGNYGADVSLHMEQYRHFAESVYAVVRTIANRIASQPVRHARKLLRSDNTQASFDSWKHKRFQPNKQYLPLHLKSDHQSIRLLEDSDILRAFRKPNSVMVRHTIMTNTIASMETTGKNYWWMRYDDGTEDQYGPEDRRKQAIPELWPLPSHWVTPEHTEDKLFNRWIVRPGGGGAEFFLHPNEVVYFYYADPSDPLSAYAPLAALAKTVMNDESIIETSRRAFLNAIAPSFAIMVGQAPDAGAAGVGGMNAPVLSREQRKALKAILMDEYRGVINAGLPMILDGYIRDLKMLNQPPKEFDFLNSGKMTGERLYKGWGMNPVSMGQLEGANRASASVADSHFCKNVVNPRLELMSEIATARMPKFFSRGRRDTSNEIVYWEPAHSEDADYDLQYEKEAMDRGAMSRNEMRERHGQVRIEGGDTVYLRTQSGAPSDDWIHIVPEDPDNNAEKSGPTGSDSHDDRTPPSQKVRMPRGTLALKLGLKATAEQYDSVQRRYEGEITNVMTRLFQDMGESLGSALKKTDPKHITPALAVSLLDSHRFEKEVRDVLFPLIREATLAGAATEWKLAQSPQHSKSFLPSSVIKNIEDHLKSVYHGDLFRSVINHVAKTIRSVTRAAIKNTVNVAVAVQLAIGSDEMAISRASRVAQVEATTAVSAGQNATYEKLVDAGRVGGRMWLSMRDDRVRDTHQSADSQVVRGTELFRVGGYECRFPGDPSLPPEERIGCRCVTVSVR
jgi:phage portal protein BeeE